MIHHGTATAPATAPAGPVVAARHRARRRILRPGWVATVVLVAVLVALPVGVVAVSALRPAPQLWAHLWDTSLPGMLATTVGLLAAVAAGTLALGASLAWLVTAYRFPGQRAFTWLLMLPLAMPAYVLGFVFLSVLDFPGPVQTGLRQVVGPDVWFPEVRSIGGAAIVLSLSLYPYVYLLARSAIVEQAAGALEAARTLGLGPLRAVRRVVLPLARPSLAAGLTLVMMETLTDFATVQYFNVQTVSVGLYQVWKGMFDREGAVGLAALVLLFALAVIAAERLWRGRARYHQTGGGTGLEPIHLAGARRWLASAACGLVLAAAFVVPVLRLVTWADTAGVRGVAGAFDGRFLSYLGNSAVLAGAATVGCVAAAVVVTNGVRLSGDPLARRAARLTSVGYGVPGPVVAIGVLVCFGGVAAVLEALGVSGTGTLATGSLAGLVYAYVTRFTALAYHSLDASLEKVPPTMTMSGLTLGAAPRRVLRRVHLPLTRAGLGVAALLIAVDALKELPVVLLLRPFGFDTLSVWVWQLASESRWESAALPALVIVAVATLPVVILLRPSGPLAPGGRGGRGALSTAPAAEEG